jgi:hypothetical protein
VGGFDGCRLRRRERANQKPIEPEDYENVETPFDIDRCHRSLPERGLASSTGQ